MHADELADAGNFTFFANYNGTTASITQAATYLECYQKCRSYNGQAISVFPG